MQVRRSMEPEVVRSRRSGHSSAAVDLTSWTRHTGETSDRLSGVTVGELAAIVARGEDSWDAIISGGSPNSALYRGFFERAMNTHRDYLTRQFQQDETIQRDIQETIVQQRQGEFG